MTAAQVTTWLEEHSPTENELRDLIKAEGLYPYCWSNGPHDVYPAHIHGFHKIIYVVRGSKEFGLPEENKSLQLKAGDRLDLPAGVVHNAIVGPDGVLCLEAHR